MVSSQSFQNPPEAKCVFVSPRACEAVAGTEDHLAGVLAVLVRVLPCGQTGDGVMREQGAKHTRPGASTSLQTTNPKRAERARGDAHCCVHTRSTQEAQRRGRRRKSRSRRRVRQNKSSQRAHEPVHSMSSPFHRCMSCDAGAAISPSPEAPRADSALAKGRTECKIETESELSPNALASQRPCVAGLHSVA